MYNAMCIGYVTYVKNILTVIYCYTDMDVGEIWWSNQGGLRLFSFVCSFASYVLIVCQCVATERTMGFRIKPNGYCSKKDFSSVFVCFLSIKKPLLSVRQAGFHFSGRSNQARKNRVSQTRTAGDLVNKSLRWHFCSATPRRAKTSAGWNRDDRDMPFSCEWLWPRYRDNFLVLLISSDDVTLLVCHLVMLDPSGLGDLASVPEWRTVSEWRMIFPLVDGKICRPRRWKKNRARSLSVSMAKQLRADSYPAVPWPQPRHHAILVAGMAIVVRPSVRATLLHSLCTLRLFFFVFEKSPLWSFASFWKVPPTRPSIETFWAQIFFTVQ
jgi:hypothetical protein